MNKLIVAAALMAATAVSAQTTFRVDPISGNQYQTTRIGSHAFTNGFNPQTGSTWTQRSVDIGNVTVINGNDSRGRSWNSTVTDLGGGFRAINSTDSLGRSTVRTCSAYGCF